MILPNEFNGGKMEHIFEIDFTEKHNQYSENFNSDEARDALYFGRYYQKLDGSNHIAIKENGNVTILCRYDNVKNKDLPDLVPLPDGKNPQVYKHHSYFYKPPINSKKMNKIYNKLNKEAANYLQNSPDGHYTIEIVGKSLI